MKAASTRLLIGCLVTWMLLGTSDCKKQPEKDEANVLEAEPESRIGGKKIQVPVDLSKWELVDSNYDGSRLDVSPFEPGVVICEGKLRYEHYPTSRDFSLPIETSAPYNGFFVRGRFEGLDISGATLCFSEPPYELNVIAHPKGLRVGGHEWPQRRYVGNIALLFFPPIPDSARKVVLKIPYSKGEISRAFTFTFEAHAAVDEG